MSLSAQLELARPAFSLDIELNAASGQTVALLGPNGSGKTTALRCLAGLSTAQRQRIEIDGVVVADSEPGIDLPPEQRSVGFVFQDYLLFPHLSALDNVAFGPRARGVSRGEAEVRAQVWLERLGVAEFARRRPGELSGGQAQRVALARALVNEPALLLLDEPLAALDAATRAGVRSTLREHLGEFAGVAVMVTHDAIDAMVLSDRVVVLDSGRVIQIGTPAEIAQQPASEYVAELVGVNLLRGVCEEPGVVRLDSGARVNVADRAITGSVVVAMRPEAVAVHVVQPAAGSPRNVWTGTIAEVEFRGDLVRLRVDGAPALNVVVTPGAVAELDLHEGQPVWLTAKASELVAYPG